MLITFDYNSSTINKDNIIINLKICKKLEYENFFNKEYICKITIPINIKEKFILLSPIFNINNEFRKEFKDAIIIESKDNIEEVLLLKNNFLSYEIQENFFRIKASALYNELSSKTLSVNLENKLIKI